MSDLESVPGAPRITLREESILDDAQLCERFAEEIPVLLINDRVHNYWRIDAERLRSVLLDLPPARPAASS